MVRGRKPTPTNLKILHGNPGKRALNDREPAPPLAIPEKPTHLKDIAADLWDQIAPQLADLGVLTTIDGAALAMLCQVWSRWIAAEANVKKHGALIEIKGSKIPAYSPYLAVANAALKQLQSLLAEFGMTPASRSRIKVDKKTGATDPFDIFVGRKNA